MWKKRALPVRLSRRVLCAAVAILGVVSSTLLTPVAATRFEEPSVEQLQGGGHVILLRHGAVEAQIDEPTPLDLADCSVQRALSAEGRSQARQIGAAFRSLAIPVGQVLSSGYCRTVYTALLAFGRTQVEEALLARDYAPVPGQSAPADFERRIEIVRNLLGTAPPLGTNTVLVTHGEVIRSAVGFELAMGEAAIFRPGGRGGFTLVAQVMPWGWQSARSSWTSSGTLWVTNQSTNDVAAFRVDTGELLALIPVGQTPIGIVAPAGTGKVYVSDEGSNQISVISKASMSVVMAIPTGPRPHHITASPDGRFVYAAEFGANRIAVIDTATDTLVDTYITGPEAARTHAVAVTADGSTLLATNTAVNQIVALDAATGAILWALVVGNNPSEVLVSPSGQRAFVSARDDDALQVLDLAELRVIDQIHVGMQPDTLQLTPDELVIIGLRGRPARAAVVSVAGPLATRWADLDGTTTGHNALSPDGRFSFVAVEGEAPGIAVINHQSLSVVATYPYPGGGRPHGVFFDQE